MAARDCEGNGVLGGARLFPDIYSILCDYGDQINLFGWSLDRDTETQETDREAERQRDRESERQRGGEKEQLGDIKTNTKKKVEKLGDIKTDAKKKVEKNHHTGKGLHR